jgi:uncharacterized protein YjlB
MTFKFADDGKIPNNPTLPLLVYRDAFEAEDGVASCKALFVSNGWGGVWVNGIFSYHHYHSNAHEALGIARGSATVIFGGEQGEQLDLVAGDIVVIPAGVGHCRVTSSIDLRVVGAYPLGQSPDLRTGDPSERPAVLTRIHAVALPTTDPVYGPGGPLLTHWGVK